ncbi:hypothetical protein KY309_03660 [Candidatus Woesearchaeota archaeon]|nr:hypothetical protein [Candidatus Woesearchaeota archaeon]
MKTHHLANIILILVLITAIAGMYYLFKGPGKAIQLTLETQGQCCCKGETGIFQKTTMKPASQLLLTDCTIICSESSTQKHPVTSLGPC